MMQYTLEDVPKGISLLYQVAAISSEGRKGFPSTTVAVSGMNQTLSQKVKTECNYSTGSYSSLFTIQCCNQKYYYRTVCLWGLLNIDTFLESMLIVFIPKSLLVSIEPTVLLYAMNMHYHLSLLTVSLTSMYVHWQL